MTEISDVSGVSYSTLNNLLDIGNFKSSVKKFTYSGPSINEVLIKTKD